MSGREVSVTGGASTFAAFFVFAVNGGCGIGDWVSARGAGFAVFAAFFVFVVAAWVAGAGTAIGGCLAGAGAFAAVPTFFAGVLVSMAAVELGEVELGDVVAVLFAVFPVRRVLC